MEVYSNDTILQAYDIFPVVDLLNKSSRLAQGVTKFTTIVAMHLATLCCIALARLR